MALYLTFLFLALSQQQSAQVNERARYEIDAKRIGVSPAGKEALPRSREFIRLDSTYYVGYLLEGIYRYEHAADRTGFQLAARPLNKAMRLLERDYGNNFRNLFSSFAYFEQNMSRFNDLVMLAEALKECYSIIERPDSAMNLLDRIESYNFQRDFMMINSNRAWIYHRNRFFKSSDFSFLGNSIAENEKRAYASCYEQISKINRMKHVNDYWYGPGHSTQDLMHPFHNLAILHSYNKQYDSSEYYYARLAENSYISWNNYAHLKEETGDFAAAAENFAKDLDMRERSLSEAWYYLPSIMIFGGHTREAINLTREKIGYTGSRPGFGWYTLALARSYLYDGQTDSAEYFLEKAANFRELHINTTLTQSQYEFTVNLLRIQCLERKKELIKFFNTGWWYSIKDLWNIALLKIEKLILEYTVVNALAYNPERERIIYELFCGESTVTFDESLYLLKDFSLRFFEAKYNNYRLTDKRTEIQRYFRYYAARFSYERGNKKEAARECMQILEECSTGGLGYDGRMGTLDPSHEKLLLARIYELIALCRNDNRDEYSRVLFDTYPQLIPYSGLRLKIRLSVDGADDGTTRQVIKELRDCNIEITEENSAPEASISFIKKGKSYEALLNVSSAFGRKIVTDGRVLFTKAEGTGKEVALRIFGKAA